MTFRATTICIVVQLGLAMMPRGRTSASLALTSGTTRGTSCSPRKALELSIITAPCFVIVSAYSSEIEPPAETKATSISLKSSPCLSSRIVYSLPRKLITLPAERAEAKTSNLSILNDGRSISTRRNSCPTAPLTPTIATFISYSIFLFYLHVSTKVLIIA